MGDASVCLSLAPHFIDVAAQPHDSSQPRSKTIHEPTRNERFFRAHFVLVRGSFLLNVKKHETRERRLATSLK
jgi:hypothetical protein